MLMGGLAPGMNRKSRGSNNTEPTLRSSSKDAVQEPQQLDTKDGHDDSSSDDRPDEAIGDDPTKSPADTDNGDDWSVDYSYLSEANHRQQLHSKYSSSRSVSSVGSSKRSWLFPFSRKLQHRRGGSLSGRQGRSTLSSLSMVSGKKASRSITSSTGLLGALAGKINTNSSIHATKQSGTFKRSKRDPLYNLSLLQPHGNKKGRGATASSSSLEAWTDTPESLQAMVQYDEADQDWV